MCDKAELVKTMRSVLGGQEIRICLGVFDVHIRVPSHATHWDAFQQNWASLRTRYATEPPELQNFDLESLLSTTRNSSSSGNYYRATIGFGETGVVQQELHRITGEVFAVKYFTEKRAAEGEAYFLRATAHDHVEAFLKVTHSHPLNNG
ncbi:hypothetical protein CFRS1_v009603 [Colletotrichum fructicola]|nr:hypothetical protein CFRS1_v009603 [Colletotrichum fructicola]